jgi:hypothetical protein
VKDGGGGLKRVVFDVDPRFVSVPPEKISSIRRHVLLVIPLSLGSVALMWTEGQRTLAVVLLICLAVLGVWGGLILPRFLGKQKP